MPTVDITGLLPAEVLAAIVNYVQPQGMGRQDPQAWEPLSGAEAALLLAEAAPFSVRTAPQPGRPVTSHDGGIFVDYLRGRSLKLTLTPTAVEYQDTFTRDHGLNVVEEIVKELRNPKL